ncbi:MAG: hypothetical protein ACLFT4_06950 [Bacteroidales bacterium]
MSIQRFIEKVCVQTAVHWSYTGPDGFGHPTFDDPVEIKCRWEDNDQVLTDNEGRQYESNAEILLTQDVKRMDYLFLGTLTDIDSEQDPQKIDHAYPVLRFSKIPMIKSTDVFVRKAFV